jgi:acetyl-CoA acetyltransferase
MSEVVIAGAAMTAFGKFLDRGVRSLTVEAVAAALADAGAGYDDIGLVVFGNAMSGLVTGQECIRAEVALRGTAPAGLPMINVENACASGSTALHVARMAVASGQCEVALAIGAEKLTHPDKTVAFRAMESALDQEELAALKARFGIVDGERSIFMDVYAKLTRAYMERSGATARDFAEVAVKSHRAAALNPKAQFRKEVTVEEVLASRVIADPLTLLMCSPIADGAAAVVVASEAWARRRGADYVHLAATAIATGKGDGDGLTAATLAVRRAYEQAGVSPSDIHVAEVHDASSPAELIYYEELGLCGEGEGPALLRSGATDLGGRICVNPSGGLLSKGHPVGATGIGQIVELVDQLRGRCGARQRPGALVALAENGGGYAGEDSAVGVVTILTR